MAVPQFAPHRTAPLRAASPGRSADPARVRLIVVAENDDCPTKTDFPLDRASMPPQRNSRPVRRAGVAPVKGLLHVDDIHPTAMLEADTASDAGLFKTERTVQPDRAGVASVPDHRHQLAYSKRFAGLNDGAEHRAADAFSLGLWRNVNSVFQRVAISGARAEGARVSKSQHATVALGHQIGQALILNCATPFIHIGRAWGVFFKGAEAVKDRVAINGGQGWSVGLRGGSDDHAAFHVFSSAHTAKA